MMLDQYTDFYQVTRRENLSAYLCMKIRLDSQNADCLYLCTPE